MLKKIIYIKNKKNKGVAKAWNQGIKKAIENSCNYFLISNNDIIFRKDSIDNLLQFIKKTNYGMATSIDTKRCFNQDPFTFKLKDEEWAGLCWSCFMLQKWTIDKVGYFDENYWSYLEDTDFEHRLNLAGIEKKSTFKSVILHNEGASGRGNNWKLGEVNSEAELFQLAYIRNKNYFANKFKVGNKYGKDIFK